MKIAACRSSLAFTTLAVAALAAVGSMAGCAGDDTSTPVNGFVGPDVSALPGATTATTSDTAITREKVQALVADLQSGKKTLDTLTPSERQMLATVVATSAKKK